MEDNECEFEGNRYPDGSELCIEDQCMQCEEGEWGASQFEVGYRY